MRNFTLFLALSLFAGGCSRPTGLGDAGQAAPKPTMVLDEWSWLPTTTAHNEEVSKIQKDAAINFSIPQSEPIKTDSGGGWGGISSTGEFVPTDKKSYFVRGGALVSKVGPVERKAKWGDWDFVYANPDLGQHAGWGNALTSGELILPRKVFLNIPTDKFVQNSFEIESFGDQFVLIRLDAAKGHKLVFLKSNGSQAPTAGYVGSKAEVSGKILERKLDGWYAGATRLSKDNAK